VNHLCLGESFLLPNKFGNPTISLVVGKSVLATPESDFRKWFVESLAPLRTNGDAGFIFE
jgi:hypothetical protein